MTQQGINNLQSVNVTDVFEASKALSSCSGVSDIRTPSVTVSKPCTANPLLKNPKRVLFGLGIMVVGLTLVLFVLRRRRQQMAAADANADDSGAELEVTELPRTQPAQTANGNAKKPPVRHPMQGQGQMHMQMPPPPGHRPLPQPPAKQQGQPQDPRGQQQGPRVSNGRPHPQAHPQAPSGSTVALSQAELQRVPISTNEAEQLPTKAT